MAGRPFVFLSGPQLAACAHQLPEHARRIKMANGNQYEIPAHVHPPMVRDDVGSGDAAQ